MNTQRLCITTIVATIVLLPPSLQAQAPVGTVFTYQGQLKQTGSPVTGDANFIFHVWDAEVGGNLIDSVSVTAMPVNNGLFTAELDFGAGVFSGEARWLEAEVEFPAGAGNWTTLAPRQPVNAAPYALYALEGGGASPWETVGSDIYYAAGNVGIGIAAPLVPLQVESTTLYTVHARNRRAAGTSYGGFFRSDSDGGYGLIGYASAATGATVGVFGETESADSTTYGVYGRTFATSGDGRGVYGRTDSSEGTGVCGQAMSATGTNFGVTGSVASPDGYAGYFTGGRNYFQGYVGIGEPNPQAALHVGGTPDVDGIMFPDGTLQTTAASGVAGLWTPDANDIYYEAGNVGIGSTNTAYPLDVRSDGTITLHARNTGSGSAVSAVAGSGSAVIASANASAGAAKGINAEAFSPDGFAVYGVNEAETGYAIGVYGESMYSPDGFGGYFEGRGYFSGNVGIGTTDPSCPLHVESNSTSNIIRVEATATSGYPRAIRSVIQSPGGAALDGSALASTGSASGVEGGSQSPDGVGVWGYNDAETGNAIGVRGDTQSPTGFGGYFIGHGYFSGNVGIGMDSPDSSLHISGPDDAADGPIVTLQGDQIDQTESGRIRFLESADDYRGTFIHYDGLGNRLHIGGHSAANSDPADDLTAITVGKNSGYVGIGREAAIWPLHVGADTYFDEHVMIGGDGSGAPLHVVGNDTNPAVWLQRPNSDGKFIVAHNEAAGEDVFSVDHDGRAYFGDYVGIGVTNPTARLHIGGYPGTDGIRFPDDTLLKTAFPFWKDSPGDGIYYWNDVGIGTDSPQSRLHVVGNRYDRHAVYAEIDDPFEGDMSAVHGVATTEGDWWRAIGVYGQGIGETGIGVQGEGDWVGVKGACVDGYCGVYALSYAPLTDALLAIAVDPGDEAGEFWGNVDVFGNLTKSGGSFKIDHPLDPENKYLYHSFVESPDMMNIYNGNVVTDEHGYATVEMPEWFEPLNRDFRYQLTVVDEADSDAFVLAKVVRKIADNCFTIRTSAPNVEVSWQVTGVRQDAWAEAHRIPVEEDKPENERGYYIHPKLYGKMIEESIEWQKLPPREQEEIRERLAANHDR